MSDFKTVVEYLGFDPEKVKTLDELKASFEPEFLRISTLKERKDLIDPLIGKRMGTIQTELKRAAKEYGVDFESDEFKGKQVEEQTKLLVHKMAENNLKVVNEFKAKEGQGNDEATKEWKEKHEKATKALTEKESLLNDTVAKYNDLVNTSSIKIKGIEVSSKKSEKLRELSPLLTLGDDKLKINGWNGLIDSYEYDLDESGDLEIRRDGKPIPNPKVTGAYMKPIDVWTEDAIKANVYKLNQQGGVFVKKEVQHTQQDQGVKLQNINPRAQQR